MVEFAFFLTDADLPEGEWPGSAAMGTELVAKHGLSDGRVLWCVALEGDHPEWLTETKSRRAPADPEDERALKEYLHEKEAALTGLLLSTDEYGVPNLGDVCFYDLPDPSDI